MDNIFLKQNVVLAHCLTQNGGAGNIFSAGKNLFQRIFDVVRNKPEISCSTIKKGDTLEYTKRTNFFGPVGLILNKTNLTFVSPSDSGTGVLKNGNRDYILTEETKPTENNIENAIINRPINSYNELCADNYNVFGVFLCFDDILYLTQNIKSEQNFFVKTKILNLPYYNLSKGLLYNSHFDNTKKCFVGNGLLLNSIIYK